MPSAEERQRLLAEATRRYMRGEIGEAEFEVERSRYEVDYLAALSALVKAQRAARSVEPRQHLRDAGAA
jgi:hypothetical protein